MKVSRRELISKKHGKAYRTLLKNIAETKKQRNIHGVSSGKGTDS